MESECSVLISLDELRDMLPPHEKLDSAVLERMPQMSGIPFVRSIKVSSKAGKAKGVAQRKAAKTITLQAICKCAGCGTLRPHLIVEESGRLDTLKLPEAELQMKVQTRMLEHASCHKAAMQRQYEDPDGVAGDVADFQGACETCDGSEVESELGDDAGSRAKRKRRDGCNCVICPGHKRLETIQEERRAKPVDY